ncbi:MAG: bifunctional 2-polyprenyl-6-hydroxyphenol methylase/3-demethylubiquinol 3-O-methyltransferase UbiG [Bradyrhizobiaceae bacterium]|nr:bifunctional 2-polyprenyl-6-hydroxyphenol methylase/3-demethylubiquinol 3-O-methyltransferase UbiG [Bradyrhizobiaceae bacterium]
MANAGRRPDGTVDAGEVARFAAMADEWWDPRGKMQPLHKLNPVRIAFIRDRACILHGRDPKALDCLADLRILDVGCGGGVLAEPLARLGARVTGIDPAEENVAAARLHAEKGGLAIDYRTATIEEIAAAGERFDIVVASEVVEHVADLDLFVERCAECVAPGGLMFVTTINRTLKSFALAIVGAEYVLRWLPVGTHSWDRFVTPDEMEDSFKAAGLSVVDEDGIVYHPPSGEWRRSDDMDVNYMMAAEKRIVLA